MCMYAISSICVDFYVNMCALMRARDGDMYICAQCTSIPGDSDVMAAAIATDTEAAAPAAAVAAAAVAAAAVAAADIADVAVAVVVADAAAAAGNASGRSAFAAVAEVDPSAANAAAAGVASSDDTQVVEAARGCSNAAVAVGLAERGAAEDVMLTDVCDFVDVVQWLAIKGAGVLIILLMEPQPAALQVAEVSASQNDRLTIALHKYKINVQEKMILTRVLLSALIDGPPLCFSFFDRRRRAFENQ